MGTTSWEARRQTTALNRAGDRRRGEAVSCSPTNKSCLSSDPLLLGGPTSSCPCVYASRQQRRENSQVSARAIKPLQSIWAARRRADRLRVDWILLPGARAAAEGAGAGGGRRGPSGRLEHLACLGWAPLRLQAGATAAGACDRMKVSSNCSRGGRGDGGWQC